MPSGRPFGLAYVISQLFVIAAGRVSINLGKTMLYVEKKCQSLASQVTRQCPHRLYESGTAHGAGDLTFRPSSEKAKATCCRPQVYNGMQRTKFTEKRSFTPLLGNDYRRQSKKGDTHDRVYALCQERRRYFLEKVGPKPGSVSHPIHCIGAKRTRVATSPEPYLFIEK